MSNALDYFDRIFVINLPSRLDRRREISLQLKSIGLELNKGNVVLFPAIRPADPGGFPNVGTRGCFMSHLEVVRIARNEGLERILVLEDDLDFVPDFRLHFPPILNWLQSSNWSLFYGGCRLESPVSGRIADGLMLASSRDQIVTTHFLALRRDAICAAVPYFERMLERPGGHPDGGPMHVDGAYNWLRRAYPELTTVVAEPQLGYQRPSRTDIHDLKWFDSIPVVRSAASLVRRLKRGLN